MIRHLSMLAAVVAACLIISPAHAFLSLVRQGAESGDVPNANDRFGRTVCAGNFDGDAFDDLAIAAPDESNGLINTAVHGMVIISEGTGRGISSEGARVIHPGDLGTDAVRFGRSMAAADFNQDGFDDLAVGAPQLDTLGGTDRGAIYVYSGGNGGLQLAPYLVVTHDDVGFIQEDGANFGWAMTAGDFDDDGYPDLATSAIGEEADTGVIYFFYGGPGGLTQAGYDTMFPFTVGGSEALYSWFGYSLQAGQFNGVGGDDLAIGAPKTDVIGQVDAGRVYLYYANASGISTTGAWYYDISNGAPTSGDAELGFSLAAGHLYQQSGMEDLAVGAPWDDYGAQAASGAVVLLEFDGNPLGYDSEKLLRQHAISGTTDASPNDRFGWSLAVGDFDFGLFEDLAIGVPFEHVTELSALGEKGDAGMFHVLYGQNGGPSMSNSENFDMKSLNNFVDDGDNLGYSLCFGSFDNSGRQAVAAGAPGADYDSYEWGGTNISNAGQAHVVAPWRQPKNHPHRGSVLLDCDGFIVYGQRPFQRMRPASTTKALTLLLACEAIWDGEVDPDHYYIVPDWVADSVGGSQTPLVEGEWLKFVGLMQTMMTVSGNDSAMLIGSILSGEGGSWQGWENTSPSFAQAMETRASQLGLSGATSLTNAAGIDAGDHYVTPLDWAILSHQIMKNECVRTIVGQTSWIVERVLPDGSSLDFFSLDGEGDGDITVFELFFASWVDGVMDRYPGARGIKPGGTPGGWGTGLSAGDPGPFTPGWTAASSFGSRSEDVPVEGVPRGCSECLHADLLNFGEDYCKGGTPDDFETTPDPGPKPWGRLTSIPPCPEQEIHAMSLNLGQGQAVPPDQVVQIDLMRHELNAPSIEVRQMVTRTSQMELKNYEIVNFGIAPHDANQGLRITNDGETQALFNVVWEGVPYSFSLQPGDEAVLPGVVSPARSFGFHIEALQSQPMILGIEELGYTYEHILLDGLSGPDAASCVVVRDGTILAENISVYVRGMEDDDCDDTLDLVARANDDVPTAVDDRFLPPAPGAFRLLPNYPNPFNLSTTLRFDLPNPATVDLAIYDLRGRRVKTLASGEHFPTGRHQMQWDGVDDAGARVASGVYILQLSSDGRRETQRMTLIK